MNDVPAAFLDLKLPPFIGEHAVTELLRRELSEFVREYPASRFTVAQQQRSWLIEWLAVVVPELLPPPSRRHLQDTVLALRRHDHSLNWHRLLPLDAALYALTKDDEWLPHCTANIDHANASLRLVALQALSLVADKLSFYDSDLQARVRSNFERRQLMSGEAITVLAASDGLLDDKVTLFVAWIDLGYRGFEHPALVALTSGQAVENHFVQARVTQYVTHRLASVIANSGIQASLLEPARRPFKGRRIPLHAMTRSYLVLPLTAPTFTLDC